MPSRCDEVIVSIVLVLGLFWNYGVVFAASHLLGRCIEVASMHADYSGGLLESNLFFIF